MASLKSNSINELTEKEWTENLPDSPMNLSEAVTQRCYYEKVFWKYATNIQENTRTEVWFQ